MGFRIDIDYNRVHSTATGETTTKLTAVGWLTGDGVGDHFRDNPIEYLGMLASGGSWEELAGDLGALLSAVDFDKLLERVNAHDHIEPVALATVEEQITVGLCRRHAALMAMSPRDAARSDGSDEQIDALVAGFDGAIEGLGGRELRDRWDENVAEEWRRCPDCTLLHASEEIDYVASARTS